MNAQEELNEIQHTAFHETYDKWSLYAHLPHNSDWSLESYKLIMTIETLEQLVSLLSYIPENVVKTCMLFFMRNQIKPVWEDDANLSGGSFSFKVQNKQVVETWNKMCYVIASENMTSNENIMGKINGITISPKKQFCIIKIWMSDCDNKESSIFDKLYFLEKKDAIFKKHI